MFWFTARTQNTFTVYPISLCMCFSLQSIVIDMKTFSLLCSLSTIHRFVTVTLSETLCSLLEWMCAKKNSRLCMYAIISGFLCGSVVWLSSVGCVGVRIFFSSKEYDRSNDADRERNMKSYRKKQSTNINWNDEKGNKPVRLLAKNLKTAKKEKLIRTFCVFFFST